MIAGAVVVAIVEEDVEVVAAAVAAAQCPGPPPIKPSGHTALPKHKGG